MKPRKVIVTIELTTGRLLKEIKDDYRTPCTIVDDVNQVQVNVVKNAETKK